METAYQADAGQARTRTTVPAPKSDEQKNKVRRGRPRKKADNGVRVRRLQITLSDKGYDRIEAIKTLMGEESAAGIIRDALRVYEALVQETHEGSKSIYVVDDNDPTKGVKLVLW